MMRYSKVAIGLLAVLAAAVVACGGEDTIEVNADNQRICVERREQRRVSDHNCPKDDQDHGAFYHPIWIYGGYPAPAVGEQPSKNATFHTVKPTTGTFAVPPPSGGFGTVRISTGG